MDWVKEYEEETGFSAYEFGGIPKRGYVEWLEEELDLKTKAGQHETIVMWRSVDEEEPPKDGTRILGARYNHTFETWDIGVIKWNGETWEVMSTRDYRLSLLPTHWKPISEPCAT